MPASSTALHVHVHVRDWGPAGQPSDAGRADRLLSRRVGSRLRRHGALRVSNLSIWILAIGVGVAAFAGDQVGFVLGRRFGRPYPDRRRGRGSLYSLATRVRASGRRHRRYGALALP